MWILSEFFARLRGAALVTPTESQRVTPVVGRDALCETLIQSASDNGCVLLFGGRQSGKSSVLRRTRDVLSAAPGDLARLELPVLLDLMRLPHDASPAEFFRLASDKVVECAKAHGLRARVPDGRVADLPRFEGVLRAVAKSAAPRSVRIVLLIDETNRVLGERFPRGFLDNLFALLYGGADLAPGCVAVFAGAQELYAFSADGTSPIGSRAARLIVPPIAASYTPELLASHGCTDLHTDASQQLHAATGGHAGLLAYAARVLRRPSRSAGHDAVHELVETVRSEKAELFQIWMQAMSAETHLVAEGLASKGRSSLTESGRLLSDAGFHAFRVERSWHELQFTGVAIRQADQLERHMPLFWDSVVWRQPHQGTESEILTWHLVERLELRLRAIVREAYNANWPQDPEKRMAEMLGADAWGRILENQKKSAQAYKYSSGAGQAEVLHFAYIGQLKILLFDVKVWPTFRGKFKDKRQLEEMIAEIAPVRNDQAHFRRVPERELQRCRLRCEDLLAILGE